MSLFPIELESETATRLLGAWGSALGKWGVSFPKLALWTVVWMAFFNLVSFNVDKDEVGLDAQVLVKLMGVAVAGCVGAWGWLHSQEMRKLCSTGWMFGIAAFLGLYFVAGLFGIDRVVSLITTICLLATVLVTCFSVTLNGWYRTFFAAYLGVVLYCFCSLAFWCVSPDAAMFAEPLPEGQFALRFRGLSHPNTVGQYGGMAIALSLVLWWNQKLNRWLALAGLLMGTACLAGSLSRASMLATALCLAFVYRDKLLNRRWIMPGLLSLGLICFAGVFFSQYLDLEAGLDAVVQKLSKSGEAEELTSATGRADIWARTLQLVAERPLLGFGANTSKYLLSEYSQYTHNMFLNTALSGGVICLAITAWLALGRFFQALKSPNVYADTALGFILINGLVENVIYAPMPAAMTIFWILALTSDSSVVKAARLRELPELN